jgi:hypothetical protein
MGSLKSLTMAVAHAGANFLIHRAGRIISMYAKRRLTKPVSGGGGPQLSIWQQDAVRVQRGTEIMLIVAGDAVLSIGTTQRSSDQAQSLAAGTARGLQ